MKTLKDSLILLLVLAAGFQVLAGPTLHTKGENDAFVNGATFGIWYAETSMVEVLNHTREVKIKVKPLDASIKAEWGQFIRAHAEYFEYQP